MNKRTIATKCPVTFTIHKMGGRWKPLIINCLLTGTRRYGEIKKAIPAITEKMLIQNLKELVTDELVIREAKPVVPPHVEYYLSTSGEELRPVFIEMATWALKHNV